MTKIYRAVVRGQFSDLDDAAKAELVADADQHTYFHSAFTAEGTFTYDPQLVAFNLRYEIRFGADVEDDSETAAEQQAMAKAVGFLDASGYGRKRLTVTITDMASIWS